MDRFRRIAHRGWLRRFLSVATFGYFPLVDGMAYVVATDVALVDGMAYVVATDVALANSAVRFLADAGVELRSLASGDSAVRMLASGDSAVRIATDSVDVEL